MKLIWFLKKVLLQQFQSDTIFLYMHTTFSLLVPIQFRCSPVLYMIVDTATYQENELSTLTTVVKWMILSSLHIVHL